MTKTGRHNQVNGPIAELATKVGGIDILASKIRVVPRTIRYWIKQDRKPSGPAQTLLQQLGAEYGVVMDVKNQPF
jgi:hypothetical protein